MPSFFGNSGGGGLKSFKGAYDASTVYRRGDSVLYSGSSYVCLQGVTGVDPTNATYWGLFASGGSASTAIDDSNTNTTTSTLSASKIVSIVDGKIDDVDPSNTNTTYSASKIENEMSGKANTVHTHTLNDITDVDVSTTAPVNDDVLTYESGKWIPKTPSSSGGSTSSSLQVDYVIELTRWGISNDGSNPAASTLGINNALSWASTQGYTNIKLPAGTYTVGKGSGDQDYSTSACIQIPSNCNLILYGCTLQKETNSWQYYDIITISKKNNITIYGGTIMGDKATHDFSAGSSSQSTHEKCLGINIENLSSGITLDGVEVTGCPGYSVALIGTYSQVAVSSSSDWESGKIDTSGATATDANFMRMNKTFTLAQLATSVAPAPNTNDTGYFCIWGNGYASFGTRYDGSPVNLSRSLFEIHCYDSSMTYKGKVIKRAQDKVRLSILPTGTTQFKLVIRYDYTQIIPSTMMVQINAYSMVREITIRNCKIHDSYALAVAITGAQYVSIENTEMYGMGGALAKIGRTLYPYPMAIDIEDGTLINQHITITRCEFQDNESQHISILHGRNILLKNNKFDTVTNGLNGGVDFQGARSTNCRSEGNTYIGVVGSAGNQGIATFSGDTFIGTNFQFTSQNNYEDCKFYDCTFIVQQDTYADYNANISYVGSVGTTAFPTSKTGSWLTTPLYYVLTANGSSNWSNGTKYNINDYVCVTLNKKVYQCVYTPGTVSTNYPTATSGTQTTLDNYQWKFIGNFAEPTWGTTVGGTTTDIQQNQWQAVSYNLIFDYVSFANSKFNFNAPDIKTSWTVRRGNMRFAFCEFTFDSPSGYFQDNSASYDWLGKNNAEFTDCTFNVIKSTGVSYIGALVCDKLEMSRCKFYNLKSDLSASTSSSNGLYANDAMIIDCQFENFDTRFMGRQNNTKTRSIDFRGNRITLNKPSRVFGAANEGIWISNFETSVIEDIRAFMRNSTTLNRPLTVYAETYLRMKRNYFESAYSSNKVELFGAYRGSGYTGVVVPTNLTAVLDDNPMSSVSYTIDTTFTSQATKLLGDQFMNIGLSSLGTGDRTLTSSPSSGFYAKDQVIFYTYSSGVTNNVGCVCTGGGWANKTTWTSGNTYNVNDYANIGGNVYKCTVKGAGTSTSQPTGTSTTAVAYGDGYSWVYIAALATFREFGAFV